MTLQQIAKRLIELANQGDFDTIYQELYSPDVVSIEPKGGIIEVSHGMDGIRRKGEMWNGMLKEFHGHKIGEPIFADDHFALTWEMTVTFKGQDQPTTDTELCVYQVKDGKVVKEQFFYVPQAQEG